MGNVIVMTDISSGGVKHRKFHSQSGFKVQAYRDVIVFDHTFNLCDWLRSSSTRNGNNSLKHPSVGHALGQYAVAEYHRSYNYNNIGEFSLNIAAGEKISLTIKEDGSSYNVNSLRNTTDCDHDILVWPDGLYISNLKKVDITHLYSLLSNEKSLESDSEEFKSGLNPDATISTLNKEQVSVIVNVSKNYPLFRAEQVLSWFNSSIATTGGKLLKHSPVQYVLSSELSEHRNATQVMVLPFEDCFEGILSIAQVKKLVERYNKMSDSD